jgi:N-acyl-phosphatidylethanolamine-hydrolysing phospholipase D
MRSFFRTLFRRRPRSNNDPQSRQSDSSKQTRTMAGGMTAAALYACTLTSPTALGAVPEDSEAKAHHLKNGQGFTNPWESWKEMNGPRILGAMLW